MIVARVIQLANGTVSLLIHIPIQAARTFDLLSPEDKLRFLKELKRRALGEVREPTEIKALPLIALAIVGVVGVNIYRSIKRG